MRKISVVFNENSKRKIIEALEKYSPNEIGGILIGVKDTTGNFIITDVSISNEAKEFRFASFTRGTYIAQRLLKKHYKNKTGFYLGEWHSHPSFALYPSGKDIDTMEGIISDPDYNVSFAILTIVKLNNDNFFESKGFLFHKQLDDYVTLE